MSKPQRMLGRYELLKRIAKGGMGEIYLARSRGAADFQKNCIIKTILPHLAEEEEFVTKFLDEGRIVVQLVHGNIVPVFDMGDEDGEYFIAMEYIPGRDLREVTKRLGQSDGVMPVDLALFLASEVCKGLDYAHRKTSEQGEPLGIVHRDVSPSNILISREGEVKLIDFGIARAAGRLGKTVSGRIQGKFCYMSPEQAAGKQLDGRSDIFSTGVVLYELLTGFRPFEGDSDLESLDLVRKCTFDPPSTLNPEVPDEVDAIVAKALEKDPDDRYQTIDRLQIEILQYLYSTGSGSTSNDLEAFLSELFPEGLERDELRSARDSQHTPKKMNLDEALDFEFARLAEQSPPDDSIDPLRTTAISSAELDDAPDSKTRTKLERPGAQDQRAVDDRSDALDAHESSDPAAGPRGVPESRAESTPTRVVAALLIVAIAGGAVALVVGNGPEEGSVEIVSDPPGAQVLVDGAIVPDATTPHVLRLEEGEYEVSLEMEGYESRNLKVSVAPGRSRTISGQATKLAPITVPEGPRRFTLRAIPEDAMLSVDGAELGTGVGAEYIVSPGEVVKVAARHDDCQPAIKQISHLQKESEVLFRLNCAIASDSSDAGRDVEPARAAKPTRSDRVAARHRIRIDTDPPGAKITIDGKELGPAPQTWSGPRDATLVVQATSEGYTTVEQKMRAGDVRDRLTVKLSPEERGCLAASVSNPFLAEFWIDGRKVKEDMTLRSELTAGEHELRVVNREEDLDHTRSVTIEPGEKCTVVSIDGNTL